MKKALVKPESEIIRFEAEDIVRTSTKREEDETKVIAP